MLKAIENIPKFKEDVIHRFEEISRENSILYKFLYEAASLHSVFIVGGFLRSVANHETPRDLDVIFNMSEDLLMECIKSKNLYFKRNKFDGFKISFSQIDLDIWTPDTNWAFASRVVSVGYPDIISKVAQGTFYNYDSLVFDLKSEKVNVTAYNDCVASNALDIIRKGSEYSEKNPGRMNNVLRAFKIRKKTGLRFSEQLCWYIFYQFNKLNLREVDSIVQYLYQLVFDKNSEKYRQLLDPGTLTSYVQYIFDVLGAKRPEEKVQLSLF